jgi:AdoMet-dependent rRNA methyltransferase SPB1
MRHCSQDSEGESEDDIEIVPQAASDEDDGEEWDVDDEDQDEIKQEKIRRE